MLVKYLITATFFGLLAAVFTRGSIFVANILLARSLDIETFGLISFAYLTALNIGNFVSIGLGQTAAKIAGKYGFVDRRLLYLNLLNFFKIGLLLIIFIAMLIALVGYYSGKLTSSHNNSDILMCIAGLILFFSAVASTSNSLLFSLEHYKKTSLSAITSSVVMIVVVFCTKNIMNANISLFSLGTGSFIQAVIGSLILWRLFSKLDYPIFTPTELKRSKKEIISFLGPTMLIALVGAPVHWVCLAMLTNGKDGINQTAIFNIAFQWYLIVSFIPAAVGNMSISFFSKFEKENNSLRLLIVTIVIVTFVAIFIGFPAIIFSDFAIKIYGNNYLSSVSPMRYLIVAAIISSASLCLQQYIAANGGVWKNFYLACIYSLLYVGMTFVAICNDDGAGGVALGVLFSATVLLLIQIVYIYFRYMLIKKDSRVEAVRYN